MYQVHIHQVYTAVPGTTQSLPSATLHIDVSATGAHTDCNAAGVVLKLQAQELGSKIILRTYHLFYVWSQHRYTNPENTKTKHSQSKSNSPLYLPQHSTLNMKYGVLFSDATRPWLQHRTSHIHMYISCTWYKCHCWCRWVERTV